MRKIDDKKVTFQAHKLIVYVSQGWLVESKLSYILINFIVKDKDWKIWKILLK